MARPRKSRRLPQFPAFRPHRNQFLFSDHYLDELLRLEREWADPPGLTAAFAQLKAKYQEVAGRLPGSKEKGTEKDWIQPVLDLLGHHYELDPSLLTAMEGVKAPDYAFFDSKEARDRAAGDKGKPSYWPQILAVGDAKKWDLPLDRKGLGKAIFTNANPNFQIDYYLRATQRRWGLLTNGRLWRLYHVEKSYTLSTYYEVDLVDLLSRESLDDFKYFYLFFRKDAFVPGAEEKCFLDRAYLGSVEFATALGDSLKKQVYDALLAFAKGALAQPANRLDSGRDLKTIHDNALIFLYRLIFILYAESRDLLPKGNSKYWNGPSLHALKFEVAGQRDKGEAYDDKTTRLWARLRRLFKMINEGDELFGIPPYNGGLFKPDKQDGHPFLEKMRLGDSVVAEIVDLLARTKLKGTGALVPVDYRSLGVRQLGSIYEGLLEFKLTVATEPMVAVKEKGKELVIPKPEVGTRKVLQEYKPGDLYAVNDKGERKATGSYFTPEYIVDYIVKHAIGPLLEAKSAKEILAMRFLDPAMGSGHFLVQVVDFVALHLVEQCPDVYDFLKGDEEDEAPALKRLVVERCVYGVDLNPLAVELAKLSLWLTCVAKDKPLSFLNHHLRCGNSLIGAWIKELSFHPARKRIETAGEDKIFREHFSQDVKIVLDGFKQIEELPSDSIRNIHKKEKAWDLIREKLRPYEQIADVWVSTFFGNDKVDELIYKDLVTGIRRDMGRMTKRMRDEVLSRTQAIAKDRKFFHWEIEFPEAFFDKFGRDLDDGVRGFDAVIGNPPYVNVTNIEACIRNYLLSRYSTAVGRFDLYITFTERAIYLLKIGGMFGFIQPIKFTIYANGKLLRDQLLEHTTIERIVDVSQCRVFPDPSTYPCVPIVKKSLPPSTHKILAVRPPIEEPELIKGLDNKGLCVIEIPQSRFLKTPEHVICLRLSDELWSFIQRVSCSSFFLDVAFDIEQCIRVGSESKRRKLVLDSGRYAQASPNIKAACKKMLDGANIERYEIVWDGVWLHYLPGELYNSKSLAVLETKKILIKRIAPSLAVVSDDGVDGGYYYPLNTIYALIAKSGVEYSFSYITALLNSCFHDWYYKLLFEAIAIRGGYIEYREYLKYLPIRQIHFTTPEEERKKQVEVFKVLYGKGDGAGVLAGVEGCLPRDGKGEFLAFKSGATGAEEKSDVVHDFLAFLAERMITLHKERQAKAKEFTSWLKEMKGIDTGTLKSALKEFWTLDEDTLAQAFKAKKIRASAENWSEIKDELAKYRKAILALNVKIAFTDAIIDHIVYRLYGLTEEEIKLVKESAR